MKSIVAFFLASLFFVAAGITGRADQSTDTQKADQLLKQVVTATQAMNSMTADIADISTQGGKTVQRNGTVKLLKPNYLLEEIWPGPAGASATSQSVSTPHEMLASDGKNYWQIAADGTFFKSAADAAGHNVGNTDSISDPSTPDMVSFITLYFNPTDISKSDPSSTESVSTETWNGQTYQVVSDTGHPKGPQGQTMNVSAKLYIGQDNLIHRVVIKADPIGSWELQLLNMKTGVSLTKTDFAFTPPSWAKPIPAAAN